MASGWPEGTMVPNIARTRDTRVSIPPVSGSLTKEKIRVSDDSMVLKQVERRKHRENNLAHRLTNRKSQGMNWDMVR